MGCGKAQCKRDQGLGALIRSIFNRTHVKSQQTNLRVALGRAAVPFKIDRQNNLQKAGSATECVAFLQMRRVRFYKCLRGKGDNIMDITVSGELTYHIDGLNLSDDQIQALRDILTPSDEMEFLGDDYIAVRFYFGAASDICHLDVAETFRKKIEDALQCVTFKKDYRCPHCNQPLIADTTKSDNNYDFECPNCDESFFKFEAKNN
jgi:hypothetical protein